ncbi:MAG: hypothetical protein M1840_002029 [Geoglossum simile]|nr:MAG: hypothetical protein M1840_002029 [Geoglossum simile]
MKVEVLKKPKALPSTDDIPNLVARQIVLCGLAALYEQGRVGATIPGWATTSDIVRTISLACCDETREADIVFVNTGAELQREGTNDDRLQDTDSVAFEEGIEPTTAPRKVEDIVDIAKKPINKQEQLAREHRQRAHLPRPSVEVRLSRERIVLAHSQVAKEEGGDGGDGGDSHRTGLRDRDVYMINRYGWNPFTGELIYRMPTAAPEVSMSKIVGEILSRPSSLAKRTDIDPRVRALASAVVCCAPSRIFYRIDSGRKEYGEHSPDTSLAHMEAEYPGVVIEASFPQKRKVLEFTWKSYGTCGSGPRRNPSRVQPNLGCPYYAFAESWWANIFVLQVSTC